MMSYAFRAALIVRLLVSLSVASNAILEKVSPTSESIRRKSAVLLLRRLIVVEGILETAITGLL